MLSFVRILLVSMIFLLSLAEPVNAQLDNVQQRLAKIEKIEDKSVVIEQAQQLISDSFLTSKQHLSILTVIGHGYHALGDLDGAIATFRQAQQLANENVLAAEEADAFKLIGVFNYFKGDFPKALSAYQASLNYYQNTDEYLKQAHLYNNIGLVKNSMGDMEQALITYRKAEGIYQQYGNEDDKVDIRFNISGLYSNLKMYDKAIEILLQIIEKRIESNDLDDLALAKSDLAIAYKNSGKYQLAEQYQLAALNYYKDSEQPYHLATQLNNLSDLYSNMGKIELAINFSKKCIALAEQQKHQAALANCLYELGKGLFHQGEIEQAFDYANQSNELAMQTNFKNLKLENLSLLALIHAARQEPEQALAKSRAFKKEVDDGYNNNFNLKLVQFESEQLAHQVKKLQQAKAFQQIKIEQTEQSRNFMLMALIFVSIIVFFIYRRKKELSTKIWLAAQVKERTRDLELLTEQLTAANKVKSQFLANMSHEIRTPLTAIIGQSEAVINGEVSEQNVGAEVNVIHANGMHLLQLVNDILDISKIEADKLELDVSGQNLDVITQDLANMFNEQAKSKQLEFVIKNTMPSAFTFHADGLRLSQILINLCSNAIKFTNKGRVSLTISEEHNHLVFIVNDTGIGMNKEQQKQVFNSFSQADSSISRRFGGTGLGLFLSMQLAEMMGGEINLNSTLNVGSTFTFSFPYIKANAAIAPKQKKTELNLLTEKITGTILLAEDHDDNRRLIARFLKRLGLDVVTAKNGKQVIELYLKHEPEVLLLDIQMPEMDGIEALVKLRELGCAKPIIALTANAMSHEVKHYLSLGFNGHLKKPIERGVLVTTLFEHFSKTNMQLSIDDAFKDIDISDLVGNFKADLAIDKQHFLNFSVSQDWIILKQKVHRLAGSSAMFGFPKLSDIAIKLEASFKAPQPVVSITLINDLIADLIQEIEQVQQS
ncbi:hypothetical protein A9Q98_12500 [Thalassotalea sp. 42_200_T64]|nr:hypothetical protein A9Q98_12500 [Thalassotalea sp. 42_200_T64]